MSEDAAARILARRDRIENRHVALEDAATTEGEGKEVLKGAASVAESLASLDAKKARTIDHVTSVRVEADAAENKRRVEEEDRRQDRLFRLQEEAVASGKANAAIEMRWNDLMDYNMPQDLHREIEAQKAACATILVSKDKLIADFQLEIRAKDEEYVKSLQKQRDEIEELIARMTEQFSELRSSYEVELGHIEDSFLAEREELIAKNKKEIDALFDKRRAMEAKFVEDRLARESQYQEEIDEMQAKDAEDFNKLKIRLETDIQVLQQQLQHMQATYLLNTEKLDYNFRVLTEKDGENRTTQIQQKRKLTKLREAQASIMARHAEAEKKFKAKNSELTEEYRRITKQYKELQQKFRHFEAADQVKFQEVWAMHEESVGVMVKRLFDADRVVHDQLLGLPWVPPTLPSTAPAKPASEPAESASLDVGVDGADGLTAVIAAQKAADKADRTRVMLEMLVAEAKFLVPSSVEEEISMKRLHDGEASVSRADAVLKAIGVTSEEDVSELLTYFFEEDADSIGEDGEGKDSAAEELTDGVRLKVGPEGVVAAVRQFVEDRKARKREATGGNLVPVATPSSPKRMSVIGGAGGAGGPSATTTTSLKLSATEAAAEGVDQSLSRLSRKEQQYWEDLGRAIPEGSVRVWKALEKSLLSYNELLEGRMDLVAEVDALRRQNQELRGVLNQYLGSKVNQELLVPPTHTIRLGGATGPV